ncbi:MAG: SIS domain-containing protein [Rhodospirillales bacterium]|nr:SIS domain-containing protein [Rhodospirillales bacterium]
MDDKSAHYMDCVLQVVTLIDQRVLHDMVTELVKLREAGGRLIFIGVGGSASNCSHAANDFRKLCGIDAYSPTDNVSELTARTNDEGWETVFTAWMNTSRTNYKDALFVLSVGGGNIEKNVSANIAHAVSGAKARHMKVFGIVGRDGGHTAKLGDAVLIIPTVDDNLITPLCEAFQAVVWHGLVSHPALQIQEAKWESIQH